MNNEQTVSADLEINIHEGQVILAFRRPNREPAYAIYNPDTALDIADTIARASYNAKYGKDRPTTLSLGDLVIERKRIKLNARVNLMLKSMLEQGKSNQQIVSAIVDQVLAEIT